MNLENVWNSIGALKREEYRFIELRYFQNLSMKVVELKMKYSRGHVYRIRGKVVKMIFSGIKHIIEKSNY